MPLTLDSMGALGILLDKHQKDELGRRINQYYKGSLLLPLASFLVVASAIGVFKGELLVIPYFLAHSVALCFLLRSSAIKSQRLASCASLVNTIYAISVNVMWASGRLQVSELVVKSWASGLNYIAHTLQIILEYMYGLSILPSPVMAAGFLIQEGALFRGLQQYGAAPSPLVWGLYYLINMAIPHLLVLHMSIIIKRQRQSTSASAAAAAAGQGLKAVEGQAQLSGDDQLPADAAAAPAGGQQGRLEAKQREAEQDLAAIRGAKQLQQHRRDEHGQVLKGVGVPASVLHHRGTVQSLMNAHKLLKHASASKYTSCLPGFQVVVIKMADTEPEQLCSDVIKSTAAALRSAGYRLSVSGVCIRRGCSMLLFDLVSTEPMSTGKTQHSNRSELLASDPATLQAWLQTLVAAEADIPDGAVAHVLVGDQRLKATWKLESRCWEIAAGPAVTAPQLSVVYADQPLVRLSGGASTGTHRLSLLLQAQNPPAALQFLGSDAHSVIPPATTSAPDVIYCTARGSWGGSMPVSVVAVEVGEHSAEEEEGGQGCDAASSITEDSTSPTHVLLMLDVDLATAPGPGAVQLELWAGLNILASAPLLLLPPSPSPASDQEADPLLEELKQHVSRLTWSEGTAAGPAAGAAAFLSDLGQVLFTASCNSGSGTRAAAVTADGPGLWGGAAAGIKHQHTSNPTLLESTLSTCQGLIEYAQAARLTHTQELAATAHLHISQSARHLLSSGGTLSAGQPNQAGALAMQAVPHKGEQLTSSGCARAVMCGFRAQTQEESYRVWAAKQCAPLIFVWKPLFHVMMVASMIGSIRRGDPFCLSDLPVHLLLCSPHALTLGLAAAGHYRWIEASGVYYAAVRLLFCSACTLGWMTYPTTYVAPVKMGVDTLVDVLLETPAQALRLPSLVATNVLLLMAAVVRARVIPERLVRLLLGRTAAVAVGAALDFRRRAMFMRAQQPRQVDSVKAEKQQQQQQQQQPEGQGAVSRAQGCGLDTQGKQGHGGARQRGSSRSP